MLPRHGFVDESLLIVRLEGFVHATEVAGGMAQIAPPLRHHLPIDLLQLIVVLATHEGPFEQLRHDSLQVLNTILTRKDRVVAQILVLRTRIDTAAGLASVEIHRIVRPLADPGIQGGPLLLRGGGVGDRSIAPPDRPLVVRPNGRQEIRYPIAGLCYVVEARHNP